MHGIKNERISGNGKFRLEMGGKEDN